VDLTILAAAAAAKSADARLVVGFSGEALAIRWLSVKISGQLTVIVKIESVELMSEVVTSEGTSVGDGKGELTPGVGTVDTPELPLGAEDSSEADSTADGAVVRLDIVLDMLEDTPEEGSTIEVNDEEGVPLDDDSDEDGTGEVGARASSSWADDAVGDGKSDVARIVVEARTS